MRSVIALVAAALVGCASNDGADEVPAELPPGSDEARALVETLNERMLDVALRSRELGQQGREAELRAIILESFDLPFIARASLGTHWNELTPEQQQTWVETYGEFHIVAAAFNWRSSTGASFVYLGEAPAPNDTVLVKTRFDRGGHGFDVRRDYRLRRTAEGWRVIDVFTPGYVSQVGMRRSEYLAVLTRTDFDGLIEDMQRRIDTRRSS